MHAKNWRMPRLVFMLLAIGIIVSNAVLSYDSNRVISAQGNCGPRNFKLPWTTDVSWLFSGGPHYTIQGSPVWSGLDFTPHYNGTFVNRDVHPVASGTVHLRSASEGWVYIDHGNGWFTHYLHMDPIYISSGPVTVNSVIGRAANKGAISQGIHLHLGFSCGGPENYVSVEDERISLEGWRAYTYTESNGEDRPEEHDGNNYEPYYGFVSKAGTNVHACITCLPIEDYLLTAGDICGAWDPGVTEGMGPYQFEMLFTNAYWNYGGESTLGCSTNAARWEQGIFWQDFDGGSYGHCGIFLSENQSNAYLVCEPYLGALYNTPNWHTEIGIPQSNEATATPYSIFAGNLIPFQFGNIYHQEYDQNAYVVRGKLLEKYLQLAGNGTGSDVCSWPTGHQQNVQSGATNGKSQEFIHCDMFHQNGAAAAYIVRYPFSDHYNLAASGFPTSNSYSVGSYELAQDFQACNMYYSLHGVYSVCGNILEKYLDLGGPGGSLGFPTSNMFVPSVSPVQHFERASIVCFGTASNPYGCHRTFGIGQVEPDVTPPETSFTQVPASCTNSGPISFGFTGSDDWTPIEYLTYATQLDADSWSVLSDEDSKVLNDLSHGDHTFKVKARDDWGNEDESPASHSFTVDAIPPETTAVVLAGTSGQNGWYTTLVDLQLNRTDTGCGSSNIQTWIAFNGGPEELYDGGPLTFDQEGIHTLEVYSVDAAGNQEDTKTFEIKIDWTPPQVSGTATGPRDTNGVFRGEVTIDGIATDNLSGVDLEEMSLDGGTNWQSLSQTVLTGSGTGRVFYRATDVAGNVSAILDSGQIIINQYVVFANQTGESLLVEGTTNILVEGDMHTNGFAKFVYNSWSTFDGTVSAVGTVTANQTNTGLAISSVQQGTQQVPMLDYPLAMYQSLCDIHHTGNLTINSVAQGIEGIHCVSGNLELRSVLLTGPVTFVVNGNITDVMVGSDLPTSDPYNGVMMIAGGNILLQGNAYDLLGLIYAPDGTITVRSNDVRINGSLVAQNIVFDGTGSGFELSYDAAFASDTFDLPLTEGVFWQPSEQQGATPTPTPTGQPSPTPTATPTPTLTATPNGGDVLYVSTDNDEEVGSFEWDEEDIVIHAPDSENWSMLFDGSDVGAKNVDALHILPDGAILVSFDMTASLAGLGSVGKEDIVKFTPSQTGETTSGTWSWYLDGSDVGLSNRDINALHVLPDGKIAVSFDSNFTLTGPGSIRSEDLVVFTPTQIGQTTTGTWAWYLDGSDVDLEEDIDGLWIAGNGDIYLSTSSTWDELSIDADDEDIFVCANATIGSNSSCTFGSNVYWDGSAHGMTGDVDALYIDSD